LGIRVQHLRERRVEEEQEERRDTRERRTVAAERMVRKEDTVRLISAEGYEFVIEREAALVSNTLKNMLTSTGSFTETQLGEVRFPEISAPILEKVCQYFYWSLQFASGKETEFHIDPEMTLELMMAANYLHT
jgi:transcription elongation factor B subunit 1